MKTIYKITRTELLRLFCSPISWLIILIFVWQSSSILVWLCERFVAANAGDGKISGASFYFIMSMWMSASGSLYYYIPLLTMGLLSRELSTGTIKLLYSSPVNNKQIVLGKFFATVCFVLVLCGFLLLYVLVTGSMVEYFEWAAVLMGLFGIFLLACTYVSIGLFLSSLTSYQFVAALGTFIVLALLASIGGWWQEYDIMRDITYWMSLNGRVFTFIVGMLCSEDLIYFPAVTLMFLSLTVIRLNSKRQAIPARKVTLQYLLVIGGMCFVAYFSSRPMLKAYYDATLTKANTLTPASQTLVNKLDGELKITGYFNVLNSRYRDVAFPRFYQKNRETFEQFERFKPDMDLKVVYYYDSITPDDRIGAARSFQQMCEKEPGLTLKERVLAQCDRYRIRPNFFVSPEELKAQGVDLRGERTSNWLIEWKDKKVWLRTYPGNIENTLPHEQEISAALKGLVEKLHKVAIVKNHGMRTLEFGNPDGYYSLVYDKDRRNTLINQGFEPVEIELTPGILKDVDILMLADMHETLTDEEYAELKDYVERGGNLMFLGESRRRDVVNPLLEDLFGVRLAEGPLVQYRMPDLRPDVLISVARHPYADSCSYWFDKLTVAMAGATAVEQVEEKGFVCQAVFGSDTLLQELKNRPREKRSYGVWNEMESVDIDAGRLVCNPAAGEHVGEYTTVMSLTRDVNGKEQRILVCGDADCLGAGDETRKGGNAAFAIGAMHYLSNNEMPFDTRRPRSKDVVVHITATGSYWINMLFKIILPCLILGAGIVLWIRRRSY